MAQPIDDSDDLATSPNSSFDPDTPGLYHLSVVALRELLVVFVAHDEAGWIVER